MTSKTGPILIPSQPRRSISLVNLEELVDMPDNNNLVSPPERPANPSMSLREKSKIELYDYPNKFF